MTTKSELQLILGCLILFETIALIIFQTFISQSYFDGAIIGVIGGWYSGVLISEGCKDD